MFKLSLERTYGSEQREREKLGSATILGCWDDEACALREALGMAMVRPAGPREVDEGDIMSVRLSLELVK